MIKLLQLLLYYYMLILWNGPDDESTIKEMNLFHVIRK